MGLPTSNTNQRKRRMAPPLLKRWLLLVSAVSMMLVGGYLILLPGGSDSFGSVEWVAKWPNCPIPATAWDVCVRSKVNYADLRAVCGRLRVSIGRCQNRHYGAIVVSSQGMEYVHQYTSTMIVPGKGVGSELDGFVQRHSRWMIDTMGAASGYEKLTTFSDEDKGRVALQVALDHLQNRCTRFFCGATNPNGFGSRWHNLGLGLAYSLFYDMTLLTPEQPKNFIPMTTCTVAQMEKAFEVNPPTQIYQIWDRSTMNYKSWGSDVMFLLKNRTMILPEFLPKGHFWWRSMLTYYAVRPNAEMRETMRGLPKIPRPCTAIHVRHSDKMFEAQLLDFSKYMEEAEKIKNRTGISDIYLMTDDDWVIQTTKRYPEFQFHYRDMPRTNKGWQADMLAGIQIQQQEVNFLMDIYSAVQCQHFIVTYSSNVGRLIGEMAFAMENKLPDVVSLDGEWIMYP